MPKMTYEQRVAAIRATAQLLVDQHFDQVTEQIAPGVRAFAETQPPELRGVLVEAMFDAIIGKLEETKVELVAALALPPAELKDADRAGSKMVSV